MLRIATAGIIGLLALSPPARGQLLQKDRPQDGILKLGDKAPDFTLRKMEGKGEVRLSSFTDKKPVVLVFGSYT